MDKRVDPAAFILLSQQKAGGKITSLELERLPEILHVSQRGIGCMESISICWLLASLHNHSCKIS